MRCSVNQSALALLASFYLASCSEGRQDPCRLLSVADARTVDDTVAVAIWAGRDGELKDDEVCVFHDADGYPRLMLFAWYDRETDPGALVREGVEMNAGEAVELPDVGTRAVALFKGEELNLLAVQSPQGVVGLRVKKSVRRGSPEQDALARLAEKALSNTR